MDFRAEILAMFSLLFWKIDKQKLLRMETLLIFFGIESPICNGRPCTRYVLEYCKHQGQVGCGIYNLGSTKLAQFYSKNYL